jgi:hypothetical protein
MSYYIRKAAEDEAKRKAEEEEAKQKMIEEAICAATDEFSKQKAESGISTATSMNASAADFGDSFDELPDRWHSAFAEGDSSDNNQSSPSKAKGAPTKGWGVRLFGFGARK